MRWPLRYQILLPFAGAMLAVVVGVSLLEAFLAARRAQGQIERQLRNVAETLSDASFPLTDAVLKQTRGLSGAEFVLTDEHGNPQATTLVDAELPSIPRSVTAGSHWKLGEPVELGAEQYFHTVVAVRQRAGQQQPHLLHILYPQRYLQEARCESAYPPLVVGSVLLGVVFLLATLIAGRLSRPILELRTQLGRLVQGDFQPVPLPDRNDELRDLVGLGQCAGRPVGRIAPCDRTNRAIGPVGPAQRRTGASVAQQRHRSADRRAASSAPLRWGRPGQPGRGPAPVDADRIPPAAVSDRWPAFGSAPQPRATCDK